jgi:hypothetical protein
VTAKIAAYYPQFSDIAFAGEVARRIGADDAVPARSATVTSSMQARRC